MMVKRGANGVESVGRTRGAGFLCLMQRAENVDSENVYFFKVVASIFTYWLSWYSYGEYARHQL